MFQLKRKVNSAEKLLHGEVFNDDSQINRETLSLAYIKGSGIEIGALHQPLNVAEEVFVSYVDRLDNNDLLRHYPELSEYNLVKVDIVDDGEKLSKIMDGSQDFLIANHFLEHCENPIETIINFFRVLKKDGILYVAVPDKRYSFDIDRPTTSWNHVLRDYKERPAVSRRNHFQEWAEFVDKLIGKNEIEKRVDFLMEMNYSIHFHVWSQTEIIDFFQKMREFCNFEIEVFLKRKEENIFVLKKI